MIISSTRAPHPPPSTSRRKQHALGVVCATVPRQTLVEGGAHQARLHPPPRCREPKHPKHRTETRGPQTNLTRPSYLQLPEQTTSSYLHEQTLNKSRSSYLQLPEQTTVKLPEQTTVERYLQLPERRTQRPAAYNYLNELQNTYSYLQLPDEQTNERANESKKTNESIKSTIVTRAAAETHSHGFEAPHEPPIEQRSGACGGSPEPCGTA